MNVDYARDLVAKKKKKDEEEYLEQEKQRKKRYEDAINEANQKFDSLYEVKVLHEIELAASKGNVCTVIKFDHHGIASEHLATLTQNKLRDNGFKADIRHVTFNMRYSDDTPEVKISYWAVDVNWS